MLKIIVIIIITILIATSILYLVIKNQPTCLERASNGYYARTLMGNSYFLSDDLDEASKMYNGLITSEKKCIKWSKWGER